MAKNQTSGQVDNPSEKPGYEDDERLARSSGADVERNDDGRLSRSQEGSDRVSRGLLDMTKEERLQFLRDEFSQSSLPSLPKIPGWHWCWLSTTNQYDTIMRRVRLGYEMVKAEELPVAYRSLSVKTGELAGGIMVNEMVLFKIPEDVYLELMKIYHHELPNEEHDKLKRTWEQLKAGQLGNKPMITDDAGDGVEELLRTTRTKPLFAS